MFRTLNHLLLITLGFVSLALLFITSASASMSKGEMALLNQVEEHLKKISLNIDATAVKNVEYDIFEEKSPPLPNGPVKINCDVVFKGQITRSPHALTPQILTDALDCFVKAKQLSKLGAQWLILKKSYWTIEALDMSIDEYQKNVANGNKANTIVELSPKPYDPRLKHIIKLPLGFGSAHDSIWVKAIWKHLEDEIFPLAIEKKGLNRHGKETKHSYTKHSFVSAFNHHAAMEAQFEPLRLFHKFAPTNADRVSPIDYFSYSKEFDRFIPLVKSDPISGRYWEEMWEIYANIDQCHTVCLQQMERRAVRGSFIMLSHIDLVKFVHEQNNNYLGCWSSRLKKDSQTDSDSTKDESEKEKEARQSYFKDQAYEYLENFSITGEGGFVGRSLYFQALDRGSLDVDLYQGQNGIVRSSTEAAAKDYQESFADTLGGNVYAPMVLDLRYLNSIEMNFKGVSRHFIEYWKFRKTLIEDKKLTGPEAKEIAGEKFLYGHPFLTETFFTPIYVFPLSYKKASLADWLELLFELNPRTPYQIIAFNYAFTGYYDKVMEAINSRPKALNLIAKGQLEEPVFYTRGGGSDESPQTEEGAMYTLQERWHSILNALGLTD